MPVTYHPLTNEYRVIIIHHNQPLELASEAERREMESKKRATNAFFKEMESNIFNTFERAKREEAAADGGSDVNTELMYEYEDDNYHDDMDDMLRDSVNSYKGGMWRDSTPHCYVVIVM